MLSCEKWQQKGTVHTGIPGLVFDGPRMRWTSTSLSGIIKGNGVCTGAHGGRAGPAVAHAVCEWRPTGGEVFALRAQLAIGRRSDCPVDHGVGVQPSNLRDVARIGGAALQ